jgi:hypothetical protein
LFLLEKTRGDYTLGFANNVPNLVLSGLALVS